MIRIEPPKTVVHLEAVSHDEYMRWKKTMDLLNPPPKRMEAGGIKMIKICEHSSGVRDLKEEKDDSIPWEIL